jgi:hypothetical protein
MASSATLANLLAQMTQNQEVLQGWDAVMNLLETAVNDFLQAQWSQHTKGTGQMTVQTVWAEGVQPIADKYFTNVHEFSFVLGAPLFQFPNGQANINVTQAIQSGSYRSGTLIVPANFDPATANLPYDDPAVDWSGPPTTVTAAANATITGTVSVQQVNGIVNASPTIFSLVLDFAQGAFTLNNLTVSGVSNSDLSAQLQDWFSSNKIQYLLSSVDTANYSTRSSFQPTSFQFNVITTNAGNTVVQILITTDGSQPGSTVINVDEPVPTADGLTCSLMISSRILYNDVLIPSFSTPGGAFSLVPIPPGSAGQIWQAAIDPQFHFAGSFSFGSCCDRTTVTYSIYLGGTYSGSATQGFVLNQSVDTSGNAPVEITVFASYPVALCGSGANQQITITPGTPQITVTGSEEGELTSDLQNILNGDFQNGMAGISFTPVTKFALQNVLFPGNLIQMSQAQVPGDLLIVGTFTPTS